MTRARPQTKLSDVDREALERAIKIDRARSKACSDQIDDKIASEGRLSAAKFAAHRCQDTALDLQPWECWPPCAVEMGETDAPGLEHRGIAKSAALLRRLLAAGRSRFEPDPIAALEAAEQVRDA